MLPTETQSTQLSPKDVRLLLVIRVDLNYFARQTIIDTQNDGVRIRVEILRSLYRNRSRIEELPQRFTYAFKYRASQQI
jgi:hypothetical protein